MRIITVIVVGLALSFSSLGFAERSGSRRSTDSSKGGMRLKARAKVSESSSSSMRSERSASNSTYANYLPFGTGQFVQNRTVSGMVFGVSQVLFLGLTVNSMQNIKKADDDVNSVMSATDQSIAANDPAALAYLDKNEKFVKENQANQKIFAGLALLSYGIGVIDAIYNPFGSMSLSAKKRNVSDDVKPGKRNSRSLSSEKVETGDSRVSLFYYQGEEKPGYGLNVKSEF